MVFACPVRPGISRKLTEVRRVRFFMPAGRFLDASFITKVAVKTSKPVIVIERSRCPRCHLLSVMCFWMSTLRGGSVLDTKRLSFRKATFGITAHNSGQFVEVRTCDVAVADASPLSKEVFSGRTEAVDLSTIGVQHIVLRWQKLSEPWLLWVVGLFVPCNNHYLQRL